MKITVKRNGGFAGIQMPPKVLETEDPLIMEEARHLVDKDYRVNLMGKPTADGLEYEITVEEGDTALSAVIPENDDTVLQSVLKAVL